MTTLKIFALSMLLAATSAFSATAAPAPAAVASGAMPDTAHAWSPDEIAAAASAANTRVPLLTYATPEGKAFFGRLTATDYFTAVTDAKLPLKLRLHQISTMFQVNGDLLITYAAAVDRGQPLHGEVTALNVLEMNYASLYAILANQVLASTNQKDPKLLAAKAQLGTGFESLCTTTLKLVQYPHFLAPNDITYELGTMSTSIVRLNVFFSPANRANLRQQLTAERALLTNPADQQSVDKMLKTLAG